MADLSAALVHEIARRPAREPVVLVVADLNFDTIYSCPALEGGREVLISSFTRELAGAGGIVASGFGRLGADVHLLADLGDDADGRELFAEVARRGIHGEGIRLRAGARSPFTLIFSDEKHGKPRQVATFQGTSLDFVPRPEEYAPILERCGLVYSCNYFLLPRLRAEVPAVFRLARARGVRTAYDANAGDGWDDPRSLEHLRERIHPLTELIFLNENEAASLTGKADAAEAAALVAPAGATAVIKRGDRGAVVRHGGRCLRVDAFPLPGAVRDTVGAGGSFQAAFLYFLLCGLPVDRCAVLGAANAASTVLQPGGTAGQLDRVGLASFLRSYRILDPGDGTIRVERAAGAPSETSGRRR